jgi:glycosyltransferase involved in cell wall biosynthesis
MKVLTFGWEFPPYKNGGLGVACYGLTRELVESGVEVTFVLPKRQETRGKARFLFADEERWVGMVNSEVVGGAYGESGANLQVIVGYDSSGRPIIQARSLLEEVHRFAHQASFIARQEEFDVIHAHDWTTYLAGIAAKRASGKKLVTHVHITSFDQAAGDNVDPNIFAVEQEGFAAADKVVTVSEYTKRKIVEKHGVDPAKIAVVHNGCDPYAPVQHPPALAELKAQGKFIVFFIGRITLMKGVDHMIRAARLVVDHNPDVVFVIAGHGDMERQVIELVGQLGLSKNVIFAGALWEDERDRMYQSADLFVMPSVSEPFGLVPLEALQHGTPSVISKQSGVSEVLSHVLKVDFWDVEEMANQILSSVRYPVMREQMVKEGREQLVHISWRRAAEKVTALYRSLIQYFAT